MIKYKIYRWWMGFTHRHHWHYAPPCYPDGDTMLRCRWCGLQQVVKRAPFNDSLDVPNKFDQREVEKK